MLRITAINARKPGAKMPSSLVISMLGSGEFKVQSSKFKIS